MTKSYNTVETRIVFPLPTKVKEPPHLVFANLGFPGDATPKQIAGFERRYGVVEHFHGRQLELRNLWNTGDPRYVTEPLDVLTYTILDKLHVDVKVSSTGIELRPSGLVSYMGVLLAHDLATGRARRCKNPKCPAPYFIAPRTDALFCGHDCAVRVAVKNFRIRKQKKVRRKQWQKAIAPAKKNVASGKRTSRSAAS